MNDFELIIFDCDGVLVDSERIANTIFAQILNDEFGVTLTLDEVYGQIAGRSTRQRMDLIEKLTGEKAPKDLFSRYETQVYQTLSTSVEAVEGIEQSLAELRVPHCVASGGSYEKMQITLGRTGLLPHFEGKLHSAVDVRNTKPAPDVYLYAAKKMGVENPAKCLVIEDSPLGVQGAVAAGMTVFGFTAPQNQHVLRDKGAHHVFDDMRKLGDEIKRFTSE